MCGYGRDQVGLPCTFLQGKETESYVVQEIVDALRHASPLICKLRNYTVNQEIFQCVLALSPVFDASGNYVFQIGIQINITSNRTQPQMVAALCAVSDITHLIPSRLSGPNGAVENLLAADS